MFKLWQKKKLTEVVKATLNIRGILCEGDKVVKEGDQLLFVKGEDRCRIDTEGDRRRIVEEVGRRWLVELSILLAGVGEKSLMPCC